MIRLVAALCAAVLAGACAVATPAAPVVVSGTLVDGTGQPVPGAHIALEVFDDRNLPRDLAVPRVLHAETSSGPDGRFEFRFAPTIELREFLGADTGFINFTLRAIDGSRGLAWVWTFPREMGVGGWVDDATSVRLVPVEGMP